ncbi:hypothetical protein J4438_01415 [Candidatus Woesearchaeota archaeon]|nr:hypothetical protein [Candidatus Woesearchaeota archaeon]
MKNFIRKVAAVSAGVVMLGTTLGAAVAADLSNLPEPIVTNGAYISTAMVVGSNDDIGARTTLKTYFDGLVTSSSDYTYSTDYDAEDDVELDSNIAGFGAVDEDLLTGLFEGEIEVNDTDYTSREVFNFTSGASINTSWQSTYDDFGTDPYLAYAAGSLFYGYLFTDNVPNEMVSSTKELPLTFLGKDIEIVSIDSDGSPDSVTMDIATEISLDSGATYSYKGHTVTLVRVYSTSVSVDVDGEEQIISTASEKDFGDDISVELDSVGYSSDDPALSSAVLKLTEQGVSSTAADGDAFEVFTDYDTNSHSPWVWDVEIDGSGNLARFGIVNRFGADDITPSQSYKPAPITVDGTVVFPNDYAALVWDSVDTENYADFEITLSASTTLNDVDDTSIQVTSVPVMTIDSPDGDYFKSGSSNYETMYLAFNNTNGAYVGTQLWGEDSEGTHRLDTSFLTSDSFTIDYNTNDDDIAITYANVSENTSVNLTITANDWVARTLWTYANNYFVTDGEADATDITINNTLLGTREYPVLLYDGAYFDTPKSNFQSDRIKFSIPSQDLKSTFKVYLIESAGKTEADLMTSTEDVTGYDNLVLVGGPCVNSVTADFMDTTFPACGTASGIAQDKAVIQMITQGEQTALVVAGWEKADTQRAATKVADPESVLTGASMIV